MQQHKNTRRTWLLCTLLIVATLSTTLVALRLLEHNLIAQTYESMTATVEEQKKIMLAAVKGRYAALDLLAQTLPRDADGSLDLASDNFSLLWENQKEHTYFRSIYFTDINGTAYTTSGNVLDLSKKPHILQALQGNQVIAKLTFARSGEDNFVLCTPIYHADGTRIIGVACGAIGEEAFSEFLVPELYSRAGYTFLCNSNGDVLGADLRVENTETKMNLLLALQQATFRDEFSYDALAQNLKSGKEGVTAYRLDGENRYLVYCRTGLNDWYLVTMLPSSVVSNVLSALYQIVVPVFLVLLAVSLISIFYILFSELRLRRREQSESAVFRIVASHSDRGFLRYNITQDIAYLLRLENDTPFSTMTLPDYIAKMEALQLSKESVVTLHNFYSSMHQGTPSAFAVFHTRLPNNQSGWMEAHYTLLPSSDTHEKECIISFRDITEKHQQELAYQRWQNDLANIITQNGTYFKANLSENRIIQANLCGKSIAINFEQQVVPLSAILAAQSSYPVHTEHLTALTNFMDPGYLLGLYSTNKREAALELRVKLSEAYRWYRLNVYMRKQPGSEDVHAFFILQDIHEERLHLEQLSHAATHDSLTGLWNRQALEPAVARAIAEKEQHQIGAVLMIDLDNFKKINDLHDHQTGDRVLQKMATCLTQALPKGSFVGRIGGDEFLAYVHSVTPGENLTKMLRDLSNTLQISVGNEVVSASIGAALIRNNSTTYSEAYASADASMYEAKNRGKHTFFSQEIGAYISAPQQESTAAFVHLQALLQIMEGGLIVGEILQGKMTLTMVSPSTRKLFSDTLSDADWENLALQDEVYPADVNSMVVAAQQCVQTGETTSTVFRLKRNPSSWYQLRMSRARVRKNSAAIIVGVITDITDIKQGEQQQRIDKERFAVGVRLTKAMIWEYDFASGHMVLGQDILDSFHFEAQNYYKDLPESMIAAGVIHPDSVEIYRELFEDMRAGVTGKYYIILLNGLNGERNWARLSYELVRDENGCPLRAIGINEKLLNIDADLRAFEEEVRLHDFMGTLIYGIARINASKDLVEKTTLPLAPEHTHTYTKWLAGLSQYVIDLEKAAEMAQMFSPETAMQAYAAGQTWIFAEYERRNTIGTTDWIDLAVKLVRHPVSGDLYSFAHYRTVNNRHALEAGTKQPLMRDAATTLVTKNSLAALFQTALTTMPDDRFYTITVIEIAGLDYVRNNKGPMYAQRMQYTVMQMYNAIATGEVVCSYWSESRMVAFRMDTKSSAGHFAQLTDHRSDVLKCLRDNNGNTTLNLLCGYTIVPKDKANFDEMVHNAAIACAAAANWQDHPIVCYDDLQNAAQLSGPLVTASAETAAVYSKMLLQAGQLRQEGLDRLTGLSNRQGFYHAAAQYAAEHRFTDCCLLVVDMDNFKLINDTLGMDAGDTILCEFAGALRKLIGYHSLCARFEADHFYCVLPPSEQTPAQLLTALQRTMTASESKIPLRLRMGVYEVKDPAIPISIMCDHASLALKSIKGNYTQRLALYREEMHARIVQESELLHESEEALASGQFVLYLQPQYHYPTGQMSGAEVLVRWQHPSRGLLAPDVFIPLFERTGFICHMDFYVWESACQLLRKWLDKGITPMPISVNVSRADVYEGNVCQMVQQLVERYNVPISLLNLEITESAYTDNEQLLIQTVQTFRAMGFTVEMDDFGSAYSSLNILKDVPVNVLKLDLKFLMNTGDSARRNAILSSVIEMARKMGVSVIAEGVETHEQAELLHRFGCRYMQGYYFAKPMPIEAFEALPHA